VDVDVRLKWYCEVSKIKHMYLGKKYKSYS